MTRTCSKDEVLSTGQQGERLFSKKAKRGSKSTSDAPRSPSKFDFLVDQSEPCPCRTCSKDVHGQDGIQCDKCDCWVHYGCSGLSKAEFNFIAKHESDNLKWVCNPCLKTDSLDTGACLAQQGNKMDTLFAIVLEVQKQNRIILDMLKNERRLEEKIKTQVEEVINDQKEKEEKKNNLILFNIPEGNGEDAQADNKKDTEQVKDVLNFVCPDVNLKEIDCTMRLGQKRDDIKRPRPVKVTLVNTEAKGKILKNAKKLKNHESFSKVGIASDKTKKEMQEYRALKEKLDERKKANEDVVIFRGQVVLRDDIKKIINQSQSGNQSHQAVASGGNSTGDSGKDRN